MKIAITSMYANPIHPGHIECLKLSKEICDMLIVIINNDKQAELKRGVPSFQTEDFRKQIIQAIKYVDETIISIDQDNSVCKSIEYVHNSIKQRYPEAEILFTKGGDRFADEIPETSTCINLGIKIVDGLGKKIYNSSNIIKLK